MSTLPPKHDRQEYSEFEIDLEFEVDPLQHALDRGSEGLDFLNTPLVLDYVDIKFAGTLPKWNTREPLRFVRNKDTYLYGAPPTNTAEDACGGARESTGDTKALPFCSRLLM